MLQGQHQLEKGLFQDLRCLNFISAQLLALSFHPDKGNILFPTAVASQLQLWPFPATCATTDLVLCSMHVHPPGQFWHFTYNFLLFYCGI